MKGKSEEITIRQLVETAITAPSLTDLPAKLGETWVN